MSVQSRIENNRIILEIDNGDKETIDSLMRKWNFSDHQSFLRFASSVLLDTNGTFIYLQGDSGPVRVSPAAHLLRNPNQ